MKLEELKQFMDKYNLDYSSEKQIANGTLFVLNECPFCDGAHKGVHISFILQIMEM